MIIEESQLKKLVIEYAEIELKKMVEGLQVIKQEPYQYLSRVERVT